MVLLRQKTVPALVVTDHWETREAHIPDGIDISIWLCSAIIGGIQPVSDGCMFCKAWVNNI
jgi:hypothetical protein